MKKLLFLLLIPLCLSAQTRNFVPRADGQGYLGVTTKKWAGAYLDTVWMSIISGNPAILGNLTVNGRIYTDTLSNPLGALVIPDSVDISGNIKLNAGYLSNTGANAGLSFDGSNNATFAGTVNATKYYVSATGEYFRSRQLIAGDAQYQTWYTAGDGARRGYFGYPSGGSNIFSFVNEVGGICFGVSTLGTALSLDATTGNAVFAGSIHTSQPSVFGTHTTTRARFFVDNQDQAYHAANLSEANSVAMAFRIWTSTADQNIIMGNFNNNAGLQVLKHADDTALPFKINPFGGAVYAGSSTLNDGSGNATFAGNVSVAGATIDSALSVTGGGNFSRGLRVGGRGYFTDSLTADGYVDHTAWFDDTTALKSVLGIKGINGQLDHSTLPTFVKARYPVYHTKDSTVTDSLGAQKTFKVDTGIEYKDGRNLGAMVSLLTSAIQEQQVMIDSLKAEIAELKKAR